MASNSLRLEDGTVHLHGMLDRAAASALWPQLQPLLGRLQAVDLTAVSGVDSAGVALLATLAAAVRAQARELVLHGEPAGLNELRAAYRLGADLDFNALTAAN